MARHILTDSCSLSACDLPAYHFNQTIGPSAKGQLKVTHLANDLGNSLGPGTCQFEPSFKGSLAESTVSVGSPRMDGKGDKQINKLHVTCPKQPWAIC